MRTRFTGVKAWWVQRVSAVYMLVFLLVVLTVFWLDPPRSYTQWRVWVAHPVMAIATGIFFIALLSHLWVGLRDVLLDYAKPAGLRRALLALVAATLLGLAVWTSLILLRLLV